MKLTNTQVKNAKPKAKPYKLVDGEGMYLLIHPNGSKYWRLNYRFQTKQKTLALGVYPLISLAEAREARNQAKTQVAKGLDPNELKKEVALETATETTFEVIARQWHNANKTWTADHRARVLRSLEKDIFPYIGNKQVSELKTPHLLAPIKRVDKTGNYDTATRLQQRVTSIMRFAVQNGITDYNPAQELAGALTVRKTVHRPALDLDQLPHLLGRIEQYKGRQLTLHAIKFALLTFVRSSEMRFARWSEIDFSKALWTLPAERKPIKGVPFSHRGSKMRTPHLVPLSRQALDVLKIIHFYSGDHDLIFIGDHNTHKPMSENTINKALSNMGYNTQTELCGHGFRAMACSALIESGLWSKDGIERQMSHQERNSVRAAYIHKAGHLEERKQMMQWWADYLDANRDHYINPFEFSK